MRGVAIRPRKASGSSRLVPAIISGLAVMTAFYAFEERFRIVFMVASLAALFVLLQHVSRKHLHPPALDTVSLLLVAFALTSPLAVSLGILGLIVEAWTPLHDHLQPAAKWLLEIF